MMNTEEVKKIVLIQMSSIDNLLLKSSIKDILIEPIPHLRKWDYSKSDEKFVCWTIGKDDRLESSFVYSEYGFGPETPWGLVPKSEFYFGMDFCWFDSLQNCFLTSVLADELPIWNVYENLGSGLKNIIQAGISYDAAENFVKTEKIRNSRLAYSILLKSDADPHNILS